MALLALTFLAYLPVVFNDFVDFDDNIYLTQNNNVLAGLTPSSVWYAWSTWDYGNWHPLTWMSLQLDFTIFGENPVAFHLVSLLWHSASVVLLFWWLSRLTGELRRSLAVAALFAVHPLHVESVAWVGERKDVLSLFFLMVTLHAYHWYIRRPGAWRYLAVTAAFACGLMCKSMLVTVPVLLFVVDLWPERRLSLATLRPRLLEKLPWLAMSLALAAITIVAQHNAGTVSDIQKLSITGRIANSLIGYGFYLARTFWPAKLCVFYPHPFEEYSRVTVATCGLLFLIASVWSTWHLCKSPWRAFGWWWFAVSLLPVIGLLQAGNQAFADRYAYIPHVGLLVLVVWETDCRLQAWNRTHTQLRTAVACAATLACMTVTLWQITRWKDSMTLWEHALSVQEANWMAHHHLAELRLDRNELDVAAEHCYRLRELKPNLAHWSACLGRISLLREKWEEAETFLSEALRQDPDHPNATFNMYLVAQKLGKNHVAVESLAKYCDAFPQDVDARCELGLLRDRANDTAAALIEFERAIEILPQAAFPRVLAGRALLKLGRRSEAKIQLMDAVKLDPLQAPAHALLGDLFVGERNGPSAAAHYQQALALAPEDDLTRTKLRTLLGK